MTIEDQLKDTLQNARQDIAGWPDPVGRIEAGITRRRRLRVLAASSCLAVVLAGGATAWTALSAASNDRGTDVADGQLISWSDAPATEPAISRRSPRPEARGCEAASLMPRAWTEKTTDGRVLVNLSNGSDSRCTLTSPVTLRGVDSAGKNQSLAVKSVSDPVPLGQTPATIDPGEPATLLLAPSRECTGGGKASKYRNLSIGVEGRMIPIAGLDEITACSFGVSVWAVVPPALNVPFQVITIDAPEQVRRSEKIRYVVSWLNSSDRDFSLDACPAYTQGLKGSTRSYRLNCSEKTVPAHETLRFEMFYEVPSDAPLGRALLTWRAVMPDGTVAVGSLSTGGAQTTVVR
jgi:hypothetical protein